MDKQWYKDRIYGYELNIVNLFSTRIHTEPKRTVLKSARRLLSDFSRTMLLDSAEIHSLWNWTVNCYNRMSRYSWGDRAKVPEAGAKEYRAMEMEKNNVADRIEFRIKHQAALDYIHSPTVFYRLSTHSNSADGHEPYQGRIFINSDAANENELAYASTHNIPNMRDVMFQSPFLCTRRNCKHVFEPLRTDDVLNNKLPDIKVIHDPQLNEPYRAYYDRKKLLIAAGVSKKNDSYKRTVSLIRKYKLR